jgi:hypothetical protein
MSENFKDDELKALILSNAKAIQALTENDSEAKRERARLYQIMSDLAQSHADLAQSHANLAQAQADNQKLLYQFMEHSEQQQQKLIKTQADITEILKFLTINKG